jgi:hypothetical protein
LFFSLTAFAEVKQNAKAVIEKWFFKEIEEHGGEHFPLWKYLSRVYIFLRNTNDSFISLSWSNAFLATRKPILNLMFLKIILQIRKKAFRKIKYQFCFLILHYLPQFPWLLPTYIRLKDSLYKTGYM